MTTSPMDVGLARERTVSAWTRTALALVINGALLLVRRELALPHPLSVALAVFSLAVAALVVGYGVRRSRIQELPDRQVLPTPAVIVVVGVSVTVLCLGVALMVLLV